MTTQRCDAGEPPRSSRVQRDGTATTNLVEADINEVASPDDAELADTLILGAAGLRGLAARLTNDPWDLADGFRINGAERATFIFEIGGETRTVKLESDFTARTRRMSSATLSRSTSTLLPLLMA